MATNFAITVKQAINMSDELDGVYHEKWVISSFPAGHGKYIYATLSNLYSALEVAKQALRNAEISLVKAEEQ